MPSLAYRKITGNWVALLDWYARQSGTWRQANQVYRRQGGVWLEVFRRNYLIGTMTVGTYTNADGPYYVSTYGRNSFVGTSTFQNGNPYAVFDSLYTRSEFNSDLGVISVPLRTGFAVGAAQIPGITKVNVIICDMSETFISQAQLNWQVEPIPGGVTSAYWVLGDPARIGNNYTTGVPEGLLSVGDQYKVYVQYLP